MHQSHLAMCLALTEARPANPGRIWRVEVDRWRVATLFLREQPAAILFHETRYLTVGVPQPATSSVLAHLNALLMWCELPDRFSRRDGQVWHWQPSRGQRPERRTPFAPNDSITLPLPASLQLGVRT